MDSNNELQRSGHIDRLNSKIESKGGLFDALESQDKMLLLDFSWSMGDHYEGKPLYKHLVDAVGGYERDYTMIKFSNSSKIITCLNAELPDGCTNLLSALQMGYDKGRDDYEYIVVSDGLPDGANECVGYAVEKGMKISTIFIGDDARGKEFMDRLANKTGGKSNNVELLHGFGGLLEKSIKGLIEG